MAKKPSKSAKPKPAAKKAAPVKAKPTPKNKPAAKKAAPSKVKAVAKKPVAKKATKPAAKKAAPSKAKAVAKKPVAKKVTKPAAKKASPSKAKAVAKKPVTKKVAKPAAKKAAPSKAKVMAKKPAAKKAAPTKTKPAAKKPVSKKVEKISSPTKIKHPPKQINGWLGKQRERLLNLKDELLDSMSGVGRDTLRTRAEGSDASGFGMHTGDAGSDAYDRDFALNLLSQERDSLFEIDAALKKIQEGTYGICELSGKPIPHIRLEARPFARYTVECQAELEKNNHYSRSRIPVTSLFGLGDEDKDSDDDETPSDSKD